MYPSHNVVTDGKYDVFISYDNCDWSEVKELATRLRKAGARVWVDKWELPVGARWLNEVTEVIKIIPVMLVTVGKTGSINSYQVLECEMFQQGLKTRSRPLIPVILKSAPDEVDLPPNLDIYNRIDLKESDPDPFERLLRGITGKKQAGHSPK